VAVENEKEELRMRATKTSLSIAAIALGGILAAAPALAQSSPGRAVNDGGFSTAPTNPTGAPSGESEQPNGPVSMMGAAGEQGGASNCAARFHSFDPATGTYLGFDGRRHTCQ
jgi:BA14K-like protein